MKNESILERGSNCWRTAHVDRGAFIIDGKDFYQAFRSALIQARERVYILAWDFNSEMLLERDGKEDGYPNDLGSFLIAVLKTNSNLHIHLLLWDFSIIYAFEREWTVFSKTLREPHPRLHIVKDDQLPMGASHHQKVVVVDDALAFCGGLDLSVWRWDSQERRVDDDRRVDPDGAPYGPYHDVQAVTTGEAARALGDLCASRWKRATGQVLPRVEQRVEPVPWPDNVPIEFENKTLGIARTSAAFEPEPAIYEIEQLHLDIIHSARRFLYFENQYFSSRRIAEALGERLREKDGPEVIIVMTQDTGWLEEKTMGALRDRLFEHLTTADEFNRLRIFYPKAVDGNKSVQVYIHAKVLIADDRWVKVGSSNLSNRSMRVDTEVDQIFEETQEADWIKGFRHRLVSTHFKMEPGVFAETEERQESFSKTLDSLVTEGRNSLHLFQFEVQSDWERRLTDSQLLDPDEPIDPAAFIHRTVPKEMRPTALRRITFIAILVLVAMVSAILIKWGWGRVIDREAIAEGLKSLQSNSWSPLLLMLVFFISGLTGIPLNAILVTCAVLFGPWIALVCGFLGAHASALAGFGLGHLLGKPLIKKFNSEKIEQINRILSKRGAWSIALIRLVPVAPFIMINLLAGASRLPLGIFNLGTLVGMVPGMTAVVFMTHEVESAVRNPGWASYIGLLVALLFVLGGFFLLRKSLSSIRSSSTGGEKKA